MTRIDKILWVVLWAMLVAIVLIVAGLIDRADSQEAPTCNAEGTCLIPPLVIEAPQAVGAEPGYTG